jgi:hypothetical protein
MLPVFFTAKRADNTGTGPRYVGKNICGDIQNFCKIQNVRYIRSSEMIELY